MSKRIPSLDGIRAVALATVIVLHIAEHYKWPARGSFAAKLFGEVNTTQWTGDPLAIFFVLSGYLITTLLLKEFEKTNNIDIAKFFERRAFRILPALFVYLALAYIFCLIEKIPHNAQNFTSAIFFYRDYYFGPDLWITQHTWSLSVEEQFYLLWPVLLIWLLRTGKRGRAAKWALALILITPFLRMGGKVFHSEAFSHDAMQIFHCRMDSLMSGCLVALLVGTVRFERFYAKYEKFWWLLAVEFWIVSLVFSRILGGYYVKSVGETLDALCMALLILWCARNEKHIVGRILNSKVLTAIGIASYSGYLYQTFFTHQDNPTVWNNPALGVIGISVMTWLSYNYVEQPFLRLRERRARKEPVLAIRPEPTPAPESEPARLTGLSA